MWYSDIKFIFFYTSDFIEISLFYLLLKVIVLLKRKLNKTLNSEFQSLEIAFSLCQIQFWNFTSQTLSLKFNFKKSFHQISLFKILSTHL